VIAVWTYGSAVLDTPLLARVFNDFEEKTIGPYWPPERRMINEGYRTIPFPFAELEPPRFTLRQHWTLDDVIGYVATWSGTERFRDVIGQDPVPELERGLAEHWGEPSKRREIVWPFAIRVGRREHAGGG
jgi:hypothetical protein